jgi:hypothetical protein
LVTFVSKHNQAWRLRKILVKLKNMLSRNMTCKNYPRRSRESMSPGTRSKSIVGNLELVGPFRQEGPIKVFICAELDELNWSAGLQ